MGDVLFKDALQHALEKVSKNTLSGTYATTVEMLNAFNNDEFFCKTEFDVYSTSLVAIENYVLTVKSGDTVIEPKDDGKYYLTAGDYTYDCTADGYTDIVGKAITISQSDTSRGYKTITVQMTATS